MRPGPVTPLLAEARVAKRAVFHAPGRRARYASYSTKNGSLLLLPWPDSPGILTSKPFPVRDDRRPAC